MAILVTGATGFVGKNFIEELLRNGYSREDVILLTGAPMDGFRYVFHKGYSYSKSDIEVVLREAEQVDAVVHLGALTPKGIEQDKESDFEENVRTTRHMLENLPNVPRLILFGSSVSVYNLDATTPDGRYGASKRACEELILAYDESCQKRILRFGPIYGPGEELYRKIAGTFLRQAMANETIHLRGDGSASRQMVYVGDLCKLLVGILNGTYQEEDEWIDVINPNKISIRELAEIACQVSGSSSQIESELPITKGIREEHAWRYGAYTGYREGMEALYQSMKNK